MTGDPDQLLTSGQRWEGVTESNSVGSKDWIDCMRAQGLRISVAAKLIDEFRAQVVGGQLDADQAWNAFMQQFNEWEAEYELRLYRI